MPDLSLSISGDFAYPRDTPGFPHDTAEFEPAVALGFLLFLFFCRFAPIAVTAGSWIDEFLEKPLTDQEFAEIFFVLFINLAGVGIPIIEQSAFRPPPCSFDVGIKEDFPFVFSHHPFARRGVLHPSFGCYIHKIVCSCPFSRIAPPNLTGCEFT
jgi:hypothetical protein